MGVIISAFAKGKGPNNEKLWLGLKAWVGASQANEGVWKTNEAYLGYKVAYTEKRTHWEQTAVQIGPYAVK